MDIEKIKMLFMADDDCVCNSTSIHEIEEIYINDYYVNKKFGKTNIRIELINSGILIKWYYKPHVSAGKFYRGKDISDGTTVNQLLSGALEEMNRLYHCIS